LFAPALQLAAIGALAGTTLCALDYGRMALSSLSIQLSVAEHLAHVTLMFLAGYLAGLLGFFALHACTELGRWAAARWHVSARVVISLVLATACLVVIVPVAVALFQGRGISQTGIARWGPWAVSATAWALCGVAAWGVQTLHARLAGQNGTLAHRALWAGAAAVLFAPLLYCDLYMFYGLYDYLHAVLMALGFGVVALGLYVALDGVTRLARLAGATAVLCLAVFVYSSRRYEAGLADFATHLAYTGRVITLARQVTDWDNDGYSHILGHEDAAALDGHIRPLAVDVPDNGTDEDGVFGDLSTAELDAARQKQPRGQSDEARAQYRALHRQALRGAAAPPNLLLITIDTLRADRVLPDRDGDPQSFGAFKQGSVRFERAYASSSYTQSSVTMMMTGRYDAEQTTTSLFDTLQAAGCTTLLAFAETPYKILDASQPNVVASFDQRVVVPDREPGDLAVFHSYAATRPTSQSIVANALALLEANRERRTCTWVYLFDVHQWQQLGDPEVVGDTSSTEPARYDSTVAYTLKQVSTLLDGLERLGLADKTVVALSGDHGEGLGEKGVVGHTRRVHNPLLHVPLFIRAPGMDPRVVQKEEVGLIDLAPTLLDLLDSERGLPNVNGASLLPLMFGQAAEHVVFAREEDYQAAFGANYKLVLDRPEGRYRLYDLGSDPAEESSLFELPGYERIARDLYYSYQVSGIGPWQNVTRSQASASLAHLKGR
jgi:hypothetical protein